MRATLQNLESGETYTFQVAPIHGDGFEGFRSPRVNFTTCGSKFLYTSGDCRGHLITTRIRGLRENNVFCSEMKWGFYLNPSWNRGAAYPLLPGNNQALKISPPPPKKDLVPHVCMEYPHPCLGWCYKTRKKEAPIVKNRHHC